MNVLVVGGAGYVGGAVTDLLMDSPHKVTVYDSLLYEDRYLKPVEFVRGDVRDEEKLLPLLQSADAVIWLAAIVGDGACAINPEASVSVNADSVGWAASVCSPDIRFIYPSTCSVYGAQDKELCESSSINPLSIYASTKLEAETYLKEGNSIIFRLGTLFGVSDTHSRIRMDLVVNTLTLRAFLNGKVTVFGGEQFRPVLHVCDAAQAMVDAIGSTYTGVYNLHRQNVRISDLAYQIRNHFPNTHIEQTPMHFEDSRNYRVNSDKARTTLGFSPERSIDSGIDEVKALLVDGRLKDPEHALYNNSSYLQGVKSI